MRVFLHPLTKITVGMIWSTLFVPWTNDSSYLPRVLEVGQTRRSGRGIRQLVTLSGSITQLIAENDRRLVSNSDSDSDNDDDDDDNASNNGDGDDEDGNEDDGGNGNQTKKQEIKR